MEKNAENLLNNENSPVSTGEWSQKEFYISSIWPYAYGPKNDDERKRTILLCKEAGLNLLEIGFYCSNNILDYCDEIGINAFAGSPVWHGTAFNKKTEITEELIRNVVYDFHHHKSVIGYMVWDEIPLTRLEEAKRINDLFEKYDPERLPYSCLFPSYGVHNWDVGVTGGTWEDSSYYKYVTGYLDVVKPKMLSFDYYSFILDPSHTLNTRPWFRDMGLYRSKSLEKNVPFWFYVGCVDGEGKNTITRSQLSVQLNVALAYGAKMISYFATIGYLYDETNGVKKLDTFDMAKELNKETMALGRFLFDKTGSKIYHTALEKQEYYNDIYFLDDITKSDLIAEAPEKLIISVFEKDDKQYMMIVSKELTEKVSGVIKLKETKQIAKFNTDIEKLSDSVLCDTVDYTLEPGGAVVFEIK